MGNLGVFRLGGKRKVKQDSIAKCSLCHVHDFTLRFCRRNLKRVWEAPFDPSWGLGIFENGETKPEHVPDNMLDVACTRYYGGDE